MTMHLPPEGTTPADLLRECVREMRLARGERPATLAEKEAAAWLAEQGFDAMPMDGAAH